MPSNPPVTEEMVEAALREIDAGEAKWMERRTLVRKALEAAQAVAPSKLNALAAEIHAANRKWWYGPDGQRLNRNKGELLMLVVTEVAEAMEGERKNLMDDKIPHRRMAEVEVVDAIVRLLDYAAGFGYDLDSAFTEKLAYNSTREDHKREAASIAAGTAHV